MLNVGDIAPDFPVPAPGESSPQTLHHWLVRGSVLLYFYPSDFTRVCTAQACMLRDANTLLSKAGVHIIGVSPQGRESHQSFAAAYGLPFTLVADTDRAIARLYGVTAFFGLHIRRVTFLILQDTRVADRARATLSLAAHQGLLRRALARLDDDRTSST